MKKRFMGFFVLGLSFFLSLSISLASANAAQVISQNESEVTIEVTEAEILQSYQSAAEVMLQASQAAEAGGDHEAAAYLQEQAAMLSQAPKQPGFWGRMGRKIVNGTGTVFRVTGRAIKETAGYFLVVVPGFLGGVIVGGGIGVLLLPEVFFYTLTDIQSPDRFSGDMTDRLKQYVTAGPQSVLLYMASMVATFWVAPAVMLSAVGGPGMFPALFGCSRDLISEETCNGMNDALFGTAAGVATLGYVPARALRWIFTLGRN